MDDVYNPVPVRHADVSVVIPVFNEASTIADTIGRIEAFMTLKGWRWEIIVVNDGSSDDTESVVRSMAGARATGSVILISYRKNEGKGYACRRGILAAEGKRILLTDADLSSPIKEADKLIASLDAGADVAIGSRALRSEGCDVRQTFKRRVSGRIFNFFVRALVLKGIRDTQCGFKCFSHDVAKKLFWLQRLRGFSFDVEILYLASRMGLRIAEVPVMWEQGPRSKVSLIKDPLRMLGDVMRIRRLHGHISK